MGISNFIGNSYSPKMCYFIYNNKFYFQIELPGKFEKKNLNIISILKKNIIYLILKQQKLLVQKNSFQKMNMKLNIIILEKKVLSI